MSPLDALRVALGALRANLLRSALTMLGIVIGVAAVIAMVALGNGARDSIDRQIATLGSNLLVMFPGAYLSTGVRLGAGTLTSMTDDDVRAITREVPEVAAAAGQVRGGVQLVAQGKNWATTASGISLDMLTVLGWPLDEGRGFTAEDLRRASKVALIGASTAEELFGPGVDPVGTVIRVGTTPVEIVGLLGRRGQSMWGQDQDDTILLPISTARLRIFGNNPARMRAVNAIMIKVEDGADLPAVQETIRTLMRERHGLATGEADDFTLRNLSEAVATRAIAAQALAWLLASIAAVSLVVGGIGVMNIMLVSVTERTAEIGLRLAVGAAPRDIRRQFLIEATALALLGGLVGIALGLLATVLLTSFAGWPVLVAPETIALAAGTSAAIGVFFGWYPAKRAAELDPIEALRAP